MSLAASTSTARASCRPGATYYEYDVIPRNKGAARDAKRIIINRSTGVTWYSPNHYTDFYRL
jgi:ribonuclease T1